MFGTLIFELTLREVIGDLPHDPGAIVAYLLLALFVGFVWQGSRRSGTGTTLPDAGNPDSPGGGRNQPGAR